MIGLSYSKTWNFLFLENEECFRFGCLGIVFVSVVWELFSVCFEIVFVFD